MPGVFRRCSSCKKDIALGATYWVCSVSTCNRGRTALAFCTTGCWDAHLGIVPHRESWAEERRAPLTLEAPAAAPASRPTAPPSGSASERAPRRVIAAASVPAPRPATRAPEPEVLIVASKLKAYIRERSEMNTSDRVFDVLSDEVRRIADLAIEEARREGRRTVLDRDFAAVTSARRGWR